MALSGLLWALQQGLRVEGSRFGIVDDFRLKVDHLHHVSHDCCLRFSRLYRTLFRLVAAGDIAIRQRQFGWARLPYNVHSYTYIYTHTHIHTCMHAMHAWPTTFKQNSTSNTISKQSSQRTKCKTPNSLRQLRQGSNHRRINFKA